jgi:hypothetical protein
MLYLILVELLLLGETQDSVTMIIKIANRYSFCVILVENNPRSRPTNRAKNAY